MMLNQERSVLRKWASNSGISQFGHSRRIVPMTRSQTAFAMGLRGGDFNTSTPSALVELAVVVKSDMPWVQSHVGQLLRRILVRMHSREKHRLPERNFGQLSACRSRIAHWSYRFRETLIVIRWGGQVTPYVRWGVGATRRN